MKRTIVAAFVALAVGLVIGRWTAPAAVVTSVPGAASVVVAPSSAPARPPEAQDCEAQLAVATELLEAAQRAAYGTPVPFPDDLPEDFRPETYEANVRQALVECPELDAELGFVDCSEYPCWAWLTTDASSGADLRKCGWWKERYPNPAGAQMNDVLRTPTGDRRFTGRAEFPPGELGVDDEDMTRRFGLRTQEAKDRFAEAWDGRDLTRREQLEAALPFWREQAEKGNAHAAEMVATMEAQLAATPEEEPDNAP